MIRNLSLTWIVKEKNVFKKKFLVDFFKNERFFTLVFLFRKTI